MAIAQLAMDKHGRAIQVLKPSTNQTITTASGASTATSSAAAGDCIVVRVSVSTDSYVVVAPSPTASASSMFMAGGTAEYFRIDQNSSTKLAVLAVTTAGIASMTEMF